MTGREFKAQAILKGYNGKQLAKALNIAEKTVCKLFNDTTVKKVYELAILQLPELKK